MGALIDKMWQHLGAEAVSVMAKTRVRTSAAANPVEPMQDANANISILYKGAVRGKQLGTT